MKTRNMSTHPMTKKECREAIALAHATGHTEGK